MTPWRRAELKTMAEAVVMVHHGGANVGGAILECLLEIETLEIEAVVLRQRVYELEKCSTSFCLQKQQSKSN